ncbi:MAG: ATP-binding cassette domain-containing protein [Bacteroidia bacterium]|nr:ATP-binding cassette domain-containing protein [Bacteroidia bacterium]
MTEQQPVTVSLEGIGKKYYQRWLFRDIHLHLTPDTRLAITGTNGSGKSTLLRIIAGQLSPTQGTVRYARHGQQIPTQAIYQHISWSGPWSGLYEDLTLREHLMLHFRARTCVLPNPEELIGLLDLVPHADKKLRYYSSGMLQRTKVGLSLFTQSDVLLLDEPTGNMDTANATRMLGLINTYAVGRVYILASNLEREYEGFSQILTLQSWS